MVNTLHCAGYINYYQKGLCSTCAVGGKLRICSGCHMHAYCSADCQKQLWNSHKSLCRRVKAENARSKAAHDKEESQRNAGT